MVCYAGYLFLLTLTFIDIHCHICIIYVSQKLFSPLCHQEESLWACLAAMAAYSKQLEVAEVAYAAIDEVINLLHYLQFIL